MTRRRECGGALASLLAIFVCGVIGGFGAWAVVNALELDGVIGAVLAGAIGMTLATAIWIGGGWLLRAAGILR
jgi:CHASE2 domain-containing sensor protein